MSFQYVDPNAVYHNQQNFNQQYFNQQYFNQQTFGYPQFLYYDYNGYIDTNANISHKHTPYAINKRPKDDSSDDETEPNSTYKQYKNAQKAAKKSSRNKPKSSMIQDEEKKSEEKKSEEEALDTIKCLQKLHNKWEKSNNTNAENLGIYLKGVIDGYQYNVDGYGKIIMLVGSLRAFCESVCNYILCGGMHKSSLFQKIEHLTYNGYDMYKCAGFPQNEMHEIRQTSNKIMHGVGYNQTVRQCFMSLSEQNETMETVYEIASWIDEYMSKYQ